MSVLRHLSARGAAAAAAVMLLVVCVLAGCGAAGSDSTQVIARVAGVTITKGSLDRDVPRGADRAARDAALSRLIAARWLIAMGESRGIRPPVGLDPEVAASAVRAALRRSVLENVPRVSRIDIVRDYIRTRQSFGVPERRVAEITNRKTKHEVQRLRREVEAGASLLTARQRRFHELSVTVSAPPAQRNPFERMIFAARPGALTGPIKLWADYVLFRVIRVVPTRYRTLREVFPAIAAEYNAGRRQLALEAFARTWTARWTSQTSCTPGYVVENCKQYQGAKAPNGGLGL